MNISSFVVSRDDLQHATIIREAIDEPEEGEVVLRVDRFALTTNNITYATYGDRMSYWQFFPAPAGMGNIPVWGFAEVVDTRHGSLACGERIYGFLPMSTHVLLRPDRVGDVTLVDASAHRAGLPPAYNLYFRTANDPGYVAESEALQALLRPVFITSFLIDDLLADEDYRGAKRVVISSASSKTAIGLATLLRRRQRVEVTALTSARNAAFVTSLGCYATVLAYDQISSLPDHEDMLYVDFSGSSSVRGVLQGHLGDRLVLDLAVGSTHGAPAGPSAHPWPVKPQFFFAPDRLRIRASDWGRDGLNARVTCAWLEFLRSSSAWLNVVQGVGENAVAAVYQAVLAGDIEASEGHVLRWTHGTT